MYKDKNKSVRKKKCTVCNIDKNITKFYNTKSSIFSDGLSPVCSDCFIKNINLEDVSTVKDGLQQLNLPFHADIWEKCLSKYLINVGSERNKHPFKSYITIINSLPQYRNQTWKDSSIRIANKEDCNTANKFNLNDGFIVTDEMIDRWGEKWTPEHYRLFENKYNKLISGYGEKTSLHTEGLVVYIRFRVQEEIASIQGHVREAKEWGVLAQKAAQDAKINVSQLSKSDISGGVDLVSQLFEAVESEVGIIPLLPRLLEQPYDDADFIIWCVINYLRRLEDKPPATYREIWNFYDRMLGDYCKQNRMTKEQIEEYKNKRNNVFKDLGEIYVEPLYKEDD